MAWEASSKARLGFRVLFELLLPKRQGLGPRVLGFRVLV